MKRLARVLVVLPVLLALGFGSAGVAQAAPIACGDTIAESVTLTTNLACPGSGLFIFGDNITVNLGGHKVTGGWFVNGFNTTITNGTTDFIEINGSVTVDHMNVVGGGIGGSDSDLRLTWSRVENSQSDGINLVNGSAVVMNSYIVHNAGNGMFVHNRGVTVINSFISENGGYGIFSLDHPVSLTNTFFHGNDILVSSPYPGDQLYLKNNKFRDSNVILYDAVTFADLGGNTCSTGFGPFLPCTFP